MDVTATASEAGIAPWLVLGIVLGVLIGVAVAGLLARAAGGRRSRRRAPAPAPVEVRDDLPGFREAPPGFPGARRPPTKGWVALAPLPPPPAAPAADDRPLPLLVGMAGAVLVLIGAAALVAGLSPGRAEADRAPRPADPNPDTVAAEVSFAGLVLERRPVGVTVTTPELRLADGRAEVTLPAWNCLADEAPADPEAAGCTRAPTEYAELAGPALDLERDGDALRVSGHFPTSTRPNGGPPEETGRAYDLAFTFRPDGDGGAPGEVRLGDDSAPVVSRSG